MFLSLSLSLSKIKFIQEQSNEHCKKHIEPTSKEEVTLAVLEEENLSHACSIEHSLELFMFLSCRLFFLPLALTSREKIRDSIHFGV
jgi:hypothetical protein